MGHSEFAPKSDKCERKIGFTLRQKREPGEDWYFTEFDVLLMRPKKGEIIGKAEDRELQITLDEEAKTLRFILVKYGLDVTRGKTHQRARFGHRL